jgi:hypothetical protein
VLPSFDGTLYARPDCVPEWVEENPTIPKIYYYVLKQPVPGQERELKE